jgi:hypothetical protein
MPGLKLTVFAAATAAALLCTPATPANAAGPLLLAPLVLGHVLRAVARLATLPLVVASAAGSGDQPAAPPYPPAPGYYRGSAGYYANYPPAPVYYPPAPSYYPTRPQVYYRPAPSYARPMPRFYEPPRGYYASRMRYSGSHGAPHFYRSGRFAYHRR